MPLAEVLQITAVVWGVYAALSMPIIYLFKDSYEKLRQGYGGAVNKYIDQLCKDALGLLQRIINLAKDIGRGVPWRELIEDEEFCELYDELSDHISEAREIKEYYNRAIDIAEDLAEKLVGFLTLVTAMVYCVLVALTLGSVPALYAPLLWLLVYTISVSVFLRYIDLLEYLNLKRWIKERLKKARVL